MEGAERVYRNSPTSKLKAALVEASRIAQNHVRACGWDKCGESAIHQSIDMMLDELRLRGEL